MRYFADTYALIEYVRGNKKYYPYFVEHEIRTSKMNLYELYYSILNENGEELAEKYYSYFLTKIVPIEDENIKEAAHFRVRHKSKELSYIDCLGYSLARNHQILFLTGDKGFKDIENVEWVSKK